MLSPQYGYVTDDDVEPKRDVVKLLLLVENLDDVVEKRNDVEKDEERDDVLEELVVEEERDDVLEELEEGDTHGEFVH